MKALTLVTALLAGPALAQDDALQPTIDGCIAALATKAGAGGGTVIDTMFSEAGSMVFLEDREGRIWQCFGYRDGTVETLEPATADEAEAALARAAEKAAMAPERISFAAGTSGGTVGRTLEAGGVAGYVLGARAGQVLSLRVVPDAGKMYYILRNPDNSILQEGTDASVPYEGELPQTGDISVEVVSQESTPVSFELVVGIR